MEENLIIPQVSINITGDTFLGKRLELLVKKKCTFLFDNEVIDLFSNSDYNIVNLESPISDANKEHCIIKSGPNLKSSPITLDVLNFLKINLVTLANNHIYDFGDKGLTDTLQYCEEQKIETVGAELTINKASKILLKVINGLSIAFLNIAENEESNATEFHGGANPMNIVANTRTLHEAKRISDIVVLIIHGGHELYSYPSPRMVEQYRYYAEEGASIIINHHSHCISGFEIYNNVPIFYGLGNFIFDYETNYEGWYTGLILNIKINKQKEVLWKLHPVKFDKEANILKLLEGKDKLDIENLINEISATITDPVKLREQFSNLIISKKQFILSMYSTSYILKYNLFRSLVRKLKLEHLFLRHEQLLSILNYSKCESHRDTIVEVIDNYINSK